MTLAAGDWRVVDSSTSVRYREVSVGGTRTMTLLLPIPVTYGIFNPVATVINGRRGQSLRTSFQLQVPR